MSLILLDCDEVLLRWCPGMDAFVRSLGLDPDHRGPSKFDLSDWLGITPDRLLSLIRAFNEGHDTGFASLEPVHGAVEGVAALRKAGYTLRIISTFSDLPSSVRNRWDNLDLRFGEGAFEGIDALPLGTSKSEALRRHPAGIMIDDLRKNVEAAREAGHTGILMAAHHNATDIRQAAIDGTGYATDWPHLLETLGVALEKPQLCVDNP